MTAFPVISPDGTIMDTSSLKAKGFEEAALLAGYVYARITGYNPMTNCLTNIYSNNFDTRTAQKLQDNFAHGFKQGKERGLLPVGDMLDITIDVGHGEVNGAIRRDDIAVGDKYCVLNVTTVLQMQGFDQHRIYSPVCKSIDGRKTGVALVEDETSLTRVDGYLQTVIVKTFH